MAYKYVGKRFHLMGCCLLTLLTVPARLAQAELNSNQAAVKPPPASRLNVAKPGMANLPPPSSALAGAAPVAHDIPAAPPAVFGQAGQIFLGGTSNVSLGLNHLMVPNNGPSGTLYDVDATLILGTFFTQNGFVQLGFSLDYEAAPSGFGQTAATVASQRSTNYLSLAVVPGIGVNLPLAANLSLAVSFHVQYAYAYLREAAAVNVPTASVSDASWSVGVQLPVVIALSSHLSLTAGPNYFQTLSNTLYTAGISQAEARGGALSLALGVLGWW